MPIPSSTSSSGEATPILGEITFTPTITAIPIIAISSRSMGPSSLSPTCPAGQRGPGPVRARGRIRSGEPDQGVLAPRMTSSGTSRSGWHLVVPLGGGAQPTGAGELAQVVVDLAGQPAPGCGPGRRRWWPPRERPAAGCAAGPVPEGTQGGGQGGPVPVEQLVGVVGELPADRAAVHLQRPRVRHRSWSVPLLQPGEDPERVRVRPRGVARTGAGSARRSSSRRTRSASSAYAAGSGSSDDGIL